jgi:hypothetical protein
MCISTPIIDPTFGELVTRVTDPFMSPNDPAADAIVNETWGLRQEYSRYPILSADNQKVIVLVLGGLWRGYYEVRDLSQNGKRLARIRDVGDPEFSWHPTNPTVLFYRYTNQIRRFYVDPTCAHRPPNLPADVTCHQVDDPAYNDPAGCVPPALGDPAYSACDNGGWVETVMTFDGTNGLPLYYAIGTQEEGRPTEEWNASVGAVDWHYYAFLGFTNSGLTAADLVVVDLRTKSVRATLPFGGHLPDWVSMSPKGDYVVALWVDGSGTRVYPADLSSSRLLFPTAPHTHTDFVLDAAGDEMLVYHATQSSQIAQLGNPQGSPIAGVYLDPTIIGPNGAGKPFVLLGNKNGLAPTNPANNVGTFIGRNWFSEHFSGITSHLVITPKTPCPNNHYTSDSEGYGCGRPGWVLISTYTTPDTPQQPFAREIFWLSTDGKGAVERLSQHHSDAVTSCPNMYGGKDYFAEPQATSSWDGTIVLNGSIWGDSCDHHYDLYTVTNPTSKKRPRTPPPGVDGGCITKSSPGKEKGGKPVLSKSKCRKS